MVMLLRGALFVNMHIRGSQRFDDWGPISGVCVWMEGHTREKMQSVIF